MAESYVNESLQFALQAIRDEATKPLHVEIERLRAALRDAAQTLQCAANSKCDCLKAASESAWEALRLPPHVDEVRK